MIIETKTYVQHLTLTGQTIDNYNRNTAIADLFTFKSGGSSGYFSVCAKIKPT